MGSYRSNIVAQHLFTYKERKCCANVLAYWDCKKSKIQPIVTLFAAVNHWSGPLKNNNVWLNGVKRSCSYAVIGGLRSTLLIFCIFAVNSGEPVAAVIMIDSSKTCK